MLVTQAQTFSASWNNWNMNFYSSVDADGKRLTRPWQNDPAAAGRTVDRSSVGQDVRDDLGVRQTCSRRSASTSVVMNNAADTKRAEAIAELMLGASLSYIALNYDKGYIVDETVDVTTLQYSNRKQMRDAAIAKLQSAATIAGANTFIDARRLDGRAQLHQRPDRPDRQHDVGHDAGVLSAQRGGEHGGELGAGAGVH